MIIIISFISCENLNKKERVVFIENSEVKGQAILYGENSSVEYSPKKSFIEVIPSGLRLWSDVQILQGNKKINPKEFYYEDNKMTFLYDSLTNGIYQMEFISHFNDKVIKTVNLLNRKIIEFPLELDDYYSEISFEEFSLKEFKSKDTLQLLFQHFGCFSFDHQLIEYNFDEENTTVRVQKWKNNWKELNLDEPIDSLKSLILQGKEYNGITGCSNNDFYTFRKKGTNKIARIEDGSCQWNGIRILIKEQNWH